MPLVRIDLIKGVRSPDELRQLADVIQEVMRKYFNAPYRDRYQIITQHEPYELICEDTNLGMKRSNKLVIIQILQQGRGAAQKQVVYQALHEQLSERCGLSGEDLIISCAENTREDWSFGKGEAQFMAGTL
ncbi:hypothetical protein APSETT444_003189 [Aspergillus pseudonomiae]